MAPPWLAATGHIEAIAFRPWFLALVVGLSCWGGLRVVSRHPRQTRAAIVAVYDLIWVPLAIISIIFSVGAVAEKIWDIGETSRDMARRSFMERVPAFFEGAVQEMCAPPAMPDPAASAYQRYVSTGPCLWAGEVEKYRRTADASRQTAHQSCVWPARDELHKKLFERNATRGLSLCALAQTGKDACTQSLCAFEQAVAALERTMWTAPSAVTATPFYEKTRQRFDTGFAGFSTNRQAYLALHPVQAFLYLLLFPLLGAALGLRVAKAFADVYDRLDAASHPASFAWTRGVVRRLRAWRLLPALPRAPAS